jgi:SAM-dependent methyltransferase
MNNNNLEVFKRNGLPLIKAGDKVLELGPDWLIPGGMCQPLLLRRGAVYHFADLVNRDSSRPECILMNGAYEILAPDNSFDVVFSLSVAEHVRKLWTWITELRRITKPGGLVICVNPVSWPYHESPFDCWRIMPEGWKALFEDFGLEYEFGYHGNVVPLEPHLRQEHGPSIVTDTIAIGRKPV